MVKDLTIEQIRRLPPKERLDRLKEVEKKRKQQEIEEKKVKEQSIDEIKLDEMLQEIDIPDEDVDIDKLFEQTENLEEDIKIKQDGGTDYARMIQEVLPKGTIDEIQNWYVQGTAPPDKTFLEVYDQTKELYNNVQEQMKETPNKELYSSPSEELVENVVHSMRLLRSVGYKHDMFDDHP